MSPAAGPRPLERRTAGEHDTFLRALDGLHHGLAFFDCAGVLLHANRPLERQLAREGVALSSELDLFLNALCDLVRHRELGDAQIGELAVRRLPLLAAKVWLRGSYIGLDLFGCGPSILITVDSSAPDLFSAESLREQFGLSRQEARVARLLAEGHRNKQIARTLGLSAHTVRHYIERIFQKLEVGARAEVAARVLRE